MSLQKSPLPFFLPLFFLVRSSRLRLRLTVGAFQRLGPGSPFVIITDTWFHVSVALPAPRCGDCCVLVLLRESEGWAALGFASRQPALGFGRLSFRSQPLSGLPV